MLPFVSFLKKKNRKMQAKDKLHSLTTSFLLLTPAEEHPHYYTIIITFSRLFLLIQY